MYQLANTPAAIVPMPAIAKAARHELNALISAAMTSPPNAVPSAAPPSMITAPRPRSRAGSHIAFNFPAAG